MLRLVILLTFLSQSLVLTPATLSAAPPLPAETSRYNRGSFGGRFRDANGHIKKFALRSETPIFDGGGRKIGTVHEPVMLNEGALKQIAIDGKKQLCFWAWRSEAGSGWIAATAIVDPPSPEVKVDRNPKPPAESESPLTIDIAKGRDLLKGLRHVDSQGRLPTGGGNKGEHYAGRNPGPNDYVYLLFACPNVQRGGVAKDSLPDGSKFIVALNASGKPISETMTMYRDDDPNQPVPVTFLYGREENGDLYGWLARANVGER